jgi:hypothetical protein
MNRYEQYTDRIKQVLKKEREDTHIFIKERGLKFGDHPLIPIREMHTGSPPSAHTPSIDTELSYFFHPIKY